MSLHLALAAAVEQAFGESLAGPPELRQDALILPLANGVTLTVRYPSPETYSLRWTWAGAEAGIDTAPLHRGLASFPNHFHDPGGGLRPDPVTRPEAAPEDNLRALIGALLEDPGLGSSEGGTG